MLLIHHDEREPRQRREDCQPGPEHDRRFAAGGGEPGSGSRHVLERAVHEREPRARERLAEARFELGREADFRHEDEHLGAACEHAGDELQIDLGLAAAGDAVQEHRRERAELGGDRLGDARLLPGELMQRHEVARARLVAERERLARQRLHGAQPRRQRRDDGLAERTLVIRGEKAHQLEPVRGQPRRVAAHIDDRFQARKRYIARDVRFDHHAGMVAAPELHGHAIARGGLHAAWHRIVEEPRQRYIERHSHARILSPGQGLSGCG